MGWLESQIDTRERLDDEILERAYAELAVSVSKSRRPPSFVPDDVEQADGALRACLRACGVHPGNVPENVTRFEERMELLCRPSGVMHRDVTLEKGWYKEAFGPLLGWLETGEPIALLPSGLRGYSHLEPGTGRKVKVTTATAPGIREEAVFFYRPLPAKKLSARDLARFILSIFDVNDYVFICIAAAAATLVGLLPAWANEVAFGTVVPSHQVDLIAPIAMLLLGVAISTVLIGACRNLVMQRVAIKLQVTTEAATFARLLSLPASFFKQYSSGNLANRISNVTVLATLITSIVLGTGLTALLSVVYLFQIAAFASALVLPALLVVAVQAAVTIVSTTVAARFERVTLESNAKLSGTVTALLNGVAKIKLAGAEDRAFARWAKGYAEYARAAYSRPVITYALPAVVGAIGLLGTVVIYYVAGSVQLELADFMAFNAAYGALSAAFVALAGSAADVARIRPTLKLVEPILEAVPETSEDKPSVGRLSGAIEVSGLTFRYTPSSPYIIKDLSFKVRPGEYVAIVGKSGCGKSTIMRLLLGFEEPDQGSIFYGPYDVSKVDLRSLRQSIGTVMQDGKLFLGDIFSNITISNPTATLDDAWEAAEVAGIADDIRKMPMGMQTIVMEGGGGVSGGQRQRLMIARAVCGKRKILMLDEATSALDNVTQRHVADSLEALKCTRIVVAHRLSTVRHCDRILVVDGGAIAEEGTYEELIAKNGIFAELVARQRLENES